MIVTVPVHNEEELLTDCLRGLKGQNGRAAGGMAATLAEWRSALANGNDILVECPDAVVGRLTGKLGGRRGWGGQGTPGRSVARARREGGGAPMKSCAGGSVQDAALVKVRR
jgi:hypothetical protein